MQVTSRVNANYVERTNAVKKVNTNSTTEVQDKSHAIANVDDRQVPGLDERANDILNQLLVGKTDTEKAQLKLATHGELITQAYINAGVSFWDNNTPVAFDKSAEGVTKILDGRVNYYKENKEFTEIDPLGVYPLIEQLAELYNNGYSPTDIKA